MTDFENAMKKVADVLHAAAKKSGEIFENTKTSYNISAEKDKILKLQAKIGEQFYQIYKEGGEVPQAIIDKLEAIAAIEDTIRALERNIADSKPYKFCSDCGAKLEFNDVYCAKCGARQHDFDKKDDRHSEKDDEQTGPCCPECGDDGCDDDECDDDGCECDECKDDDNGDSVRSDAGCDDGP